MSFSFNFPDPAKADIDVDNEKTHILENEKEEVTEDFKEIKDTARSLDNNLTRQVYHISEDLNVTCLDSKEVEGELCKMTGSSGGLKQAVNQHSDLIPNIYEGGLKVWECCLDLTQYLNSCNISWENKKVLELGCGAGIPGIVTMLKGAAIIHFQDYNPEVIEHYTIPNVRLNIPPHCLSTCRYFSGDWGKFKTGMAMENIKYDMILTAETIYTPVKYRKLAEVFRDFLADDGVIYVAAKSNYFGVGGGTRDFESFIQADGSFNIKTCHTIHAGVPREILELKFKK